MADTLPTLLRPAGDMRDLRQENPPAHLPAALRAELIPVIEDRPNWDGIVTIEGQGVHHWLHISAGEVISMLGFLTPQLTASLGGADTPDMDALDATLSRPERLAAELRSAQVAKNAEAITGHLIGAELAATKAYWLGQEVITRGQGPYAKALATQGVSVITR